MKIGGKEAMKTVKIGVPSFIPNHNNAKTNHAMGGTPMRNVKIGRVNKTALRESPTKIPATEPHAAANKKPMMARRAVIPICAQFSLFSNKAKSRKKDAFGLGKIKAPKCSAANAHKAKNKAMLASAPQALHK